MARHRVDIAMREVGQRCPLEKRRFAGGSVKFHHIHGVIPAKSGVWTDRNVC